MVKCDQCQSIDTESVDLEGKNFFQCLSCGYKKITDAKTPKTLFVKRKYKPRPTVENIRQEILDEQSLFSWDEPSVLI